MAARALLQPTRHPQDASGHLELLAELFNGSPVKDEDMINDSWRGASRDQGGYCTAEYTGGMSGIDHPRERIFRGSLVLATTADCLPGCRSGREMVIVLPNSFGSQRKFAD